MTTHILNIGYTTGQTLTAQRFALNNDTVAETTAVVSEATNRKGRYNLSFTNVAAGDYLIVYFVGAVGVGSEYVTFAGVDNEVVRPWSETNVPAILVDTDVTIPAAIAAISDGAVAIPVTRSVSDDTPITFSWPVSGATITVRRSINNASYEATAGAVSFLRTEVGKHYYVLAFNAADRPTDPGTARYEFIDGTYTRFVTVTVNECEGGGGGPGLTGPFTRTITVTDSVSGDPIQNATVRFFRTGETETKATNVSGVASFTVEAATWSYAIVASGYAGASGTVVVSESGDTGVVMVASVVSVADTPLCAVTLPIKDQYGQPLPATMVTLMFAGVTAGAAPAGIVMSPPPVQASDSAGIVQVNLIRLAKYTATYRIGDQTRQVSFTVPDAGSFLVTEV